jgi:hypothetical protein
MQCRSAGAGAALVGPFSSRWHPQQRGQRLGAFRWNLPSTNYTTTPAHPPVSHPPRVPPAQPPETPPARVARVAAAAAGGRE